MVFLYTSATIQNAEITHIILIFTAMMQQLKITAHDQNHSTSHGDCEYVIILQC